MNKIILCGRLTRDPEMTTTSSGISCLRFNIASKSKQKDENGEFNTNFFKCVAWRKGAELINSYCKKGSLLQLAGTMDSRNFEKGDGSKQTIWEITVEDIEFLSSAEETSEEKPKKAQKTTKTNEPVLLDDIDDEDLPF